MTYKPRTIKLVGQSQADTALAAIKNAPVGSGLEVVIRKEVKTRKLSQNAAYFAGPLKDIEEQAFISGRQYSAEIWHEHFKREFLPGEDDPDLAELVRDPESYRKWSETPKGDRICIGSTTQLTIKGFAQYMTQVEAFGSSLGVMFHEAPGRNE